MKHLPFSKTVVLRYVEAATGNLIDSIKMREFYEWNENGKAYEKVRHYDLARESAVNPHRDGVID